MPLIYIVSDSKNLRNTVTSALAGPNNELVELTNGNELLDLLKEDHPDLIILDLQIANMGATAITLDIRLLEAANRMELTKILVLLDRRADVFMTRRSAADGFLLKPFNSLKIRKAVNEVLTTGKFEDTSFAPAK